MAITVPQETGPDSAAYTAGVKTYTLLSALTVGDFVVTGVANLLGRTFSSVTLGGQSMTLVTGTNLVGSGSRLALYGRVVDGTESGQDIVVTLSGSDGNNSGMYALVIRGLVSTPLASAVGASETAASAQTLDIGPVTPPADENIVVGFSQRGNRTWTEDAGWTDIGAAANQWACVYDIQATASGRSWSISTVDPASFIDGAIASFAGAGGSLLWLPVLHHASGASRTGVVASGMTPRGSGA